MLKLMRPPLPSDAALAIIEAGATKKKRLYYPYAEGRFIPILFGFFPDAMSKLFRYVWERKGMIDRLINNVTLVPFN